MRTKQFANPKLNILCLFLLIILSACHPGVKEEPGKPEPLVKIKPAMYPQFRDHFQFERLVDSIDNSLSYFKRVPLDRSYSYGIDRFSAGHMIVSLERFKAFLETRPNASQLNAFIRSKYLVYEAGGGTDTPVLFTGYYEPTYEGALKKSDTYLYPLYSKPDDMLEIDLSAFRDQYKGHRRLMARINESKTKIIPYYSREQINQIDKFYERAVPVAWLKSRVDRFFLEIQGSGRVDLGDGQILRVHYAGSNGNEYRSVGRYLINKNEILKEDMSMQAIRDWLSFHPDRMDEILHYNKSVVFFKKEKDGPYGSLGVKVTPFRSLATDARVYPKGGLCFVSSQLPDRVRINPIKEWEPASFFCLNQDTGGAIKGPARADIFCGNDNYAEYTAGHMNVRGRLYYLVLKP